MKRRIFLFSGMGGDSRLMEPLKVPGVEVITPNHLEPFDGEELADYAARVATARGVEPSDVVGGASFGGMVAAEIAQQQQVAGLILLGSCLDSNRLPWTYKWTERLGRLIPDGWLKVRSWPPLVRWRFAPVSPEAESALIAMADDCPTSQIRRFGRMIIRWRGAKSATTPRLCIHGARDRIIPLSAAETGVIFPDAGHAFTLTHAQETCAEILKFLGTLSSPAV
jgi:pimeloyl-ACP methyl ester carboxylesterase